MLKEKHVANFDEKCAEWLEGFVKAETCYTIKDIFRIGKMIGYTKAQIKAARAYHGLKIITAFGCLWRWHERA